MHHFTSLSLISVLITAISSNSELIRLGRRDAWASSSSSSSSSAACSCSSLPPVRSRCCHRYWQHGQRPLARMRAAVPRPDEAPAKRARRRPQAGVAAQQQRPPAHQATAAPRLRVPIGAASWAFRTRPAAAAGTIAPRAAEAASAWLPRPRPLSPCFAPQAPWLASTALVSVPGPA